MTDERIREEFDTWISDIECTDNERRFFNQYPSIDQPIAVGFYAGFRAAERLAKIEALEEVRIKITLLDTTVPDNVVFSHYMQGQVDLNKEALKAIDSMIAELKEEGE
jgi:hypothetical protein